MANFWMHNGFLQVEGRKMSKSEGNFVTIHELLDTEKFGGRRWPGEVLRLAMLMTHYREPIDFSVRKLEEAEQRSAQVETGARSSWRCRAVKQRRRLRYRCGEAIARRHLCDDLSTPSAMQIARDAWPLTRQLIASAASAARRLALSVSRLRRRARLLSDRRRDRGSRRSTAASRSSRDKNWAEADRIRDELLAQGIQLKDGKDPATGERVTTWEVRR